MFTLHKHYNPQNLKEVTFRTHLFVELKIYADDTYARMSFLRSSLRKCVAEKYL